MQIKLLNQSPRFANLALPSVPRAPAPSSRWEGWSDSRPIALDRQAVRLMQAEAMRLAARAAQARIAADHAAEAAKRAMFRRAADAFEARARGFEALLEDA